MSSKKRKDSAGSRKQRSRAQLSSKNRLFLRSAGSSWVLGPLSQHGAHDWSDDPTDEANNQSSDSGLDRGSSTDHSIENGADGEVFGSDL